MPAGTQVKLKLLKDDSIFLTATTDADGFAEFQANGSPGQMYMEATVSGQTRRVYGSVSGQVLTWFQSELPSALLAYADGYFSASPNGTMAVTPGTGLAVSVAGGAAIGHGVLGTFYTATTLAVAANSSGSTRIDRVVYRAYLTGVDLGKTELAVVTGTTVAPALTQTSAIWEISLATVSVPNGAGSLVSGNITDTRVAVTVPIADGSVSFAKLADNAVITNKIADNAVTAAKLIASAVTTAKIADASVTAAKLAAGAIPPSNPIIPNIWQFGTATAVSSGSAGPRTMTSQTSSVLLNGVTYDWTADLAAVLPNNVSSGTVDLTVTVNGSARTFRCTTNGGVTTPHVVFGGGNGIAGTGAGVAVSATVTWISGDQTNINGGQVRVTFQPR